MSSSYADNILSAELNIKFQLRLLHLEDMEELENQVYILGEELLKVLKDSSQNFFDPNNLTEKFLSLGMKNEQLKIALFRFVDVLANLETSPAVIRHVQEYFDPLRGELPDLLFKAMSISPNSLTGAVISRAIKQQIKFVAKKFFVGSNAENSVKTLKKINDKGYCFTVDLVGESAVSAHEAEYYKNSYLDLIKTLNTRSKDWETPQSLKNHINGPYVNNISVKLSALYSRAKAVATEHSVNKIYENLRPILELAKEQNTYIYIDMEDCSMTEITLEVFKKAISEFKESHKIGIVLQAYLKRTENDIKDLTEFLKTRGCPVGVRLVKGAYWDTETILAEQKGWDVPVWQTKSSSDANYEKLTEVLLDNDDLFIPAFASHNLRSLAYAIKYAESKGVEKTNFEIQTLYGMAEPIKTELSKKGYLVRDYSPVGELIPGMGYLVRRLLENTANEGFLKQSNFDSIESSKLLTKPSFAEPEKESIEATNSNTCNTNADLNSSGSNYTGSEFENLAYIDFTIKSNRETLKEKISELKSQEAREVFPIIEGKEIKTNSSIDSNCPEDKNKVLAKIGLADTTSCEQAIKALSSFSKTWAKTSVDERAKILEDTAETILKKRFDIIPVMVMESGKSWIGADAELAEAVDFLRFYAMKARELMKPRRLQNTPGEDNFLNYHPRGISTIITPWNFPFAIPCGMFSAALVTGNCAILKPAEQTSLTAKVLFDCFLESGLPKSAAAFLPGLGEEIGNYLALHPSIETIAFTGSKNVGLSLIEQCAKYRVGSKHIKKVIAEMGGKNFIIIDEDADLDEAVKGVIKSAFGFQGQKCSACSIVLTVGKSRFLERLKEAVKSLQISPPSSAASDVGPVIDEEAFLRINETIKKAKKDCTVLSETPAKMNKAMQKDSEEYSNGFFIRPIAFTEVETKSSLFKDEVFGPVLICNSVETLEEAIDLANTSKYGLTAGIFSRSPRNIEYTCQNLEVGNLYINRSCTGAMVQRHPFGGSKLSGIGNKAGGTDYLAQFVVPKSISENTMRRGFAPESE